MAAYGSKCWKEMFNSQVLDLWTDLLSVFSAAGALHLKALLQLQQSETKKYSLSCLPSNAVTLQVYLCFSCSPPVTLKRNKRLLGADRWIENKRMCII